MASLEACPVCRAGLDGQPPACPSCGTDLTYYYDLAARAGELTRMAREWLARGERELAREVVARLSQLVPDPGAGYHALAARLALLEGNEASASDHAAKAGDEREALLKLIADGQAGRMNAREQYNYALTEARNGGYAAAARHLALAVLDAPGETQIWRVKLKCDLRLADWPAVYADLAALDRLGARPAEAGGLEAQLPQLPAELRAS